MNNQNNRSISRTRLTRAIVASGSLLAIIVIGLPWVDEYFRLRSDAIEFTKLESQYVEMQARQAQLVRIEDKLAQQLDRFLVRSVDPSKQEFVRGELIESVRHGGGRLRRLEMAAGETRIWGLENDNPRNGMLPHYGEESQFILQTQFVELQADGPLDSIRQVISNVANQGWLMTTKSLTVVPTNVRESPVSLEWHLVLYGLGPNENEPEEDFAELNESTDLR